MIDDLSPAEREALGALRASRGACPPAEALVEYESLSATDRQRHAHHAHIVTCSRCQLALLHMHEPTQSSSMLKWVLPIAAVAVLGVALTFVDRRGGPGVPPADTVRGTEIQPIAPVGTVAVVPEFSWQSPLRVDRYHIVVYAGSAVVWQAETRETRIKPPDLKIGALRWIVEGLDREGNVRITSPPQSFEYRPRVY